MSSVMPDPIDKERLAETSTGDKEFERILLSAYLEEAQQQCADIEAAIEAGAATPLSHAAHSLKGASANVGASEVRKISAVLERLDPASDVEGARILLSDLRVEVGRVVEFVNQYLGE